jgi:Ca-activated chloride channel family protein
MEKSTSFSGFSRSHAVLLFFLTAAPLFPQGAQSPPPADTKKASPSEEPGYSLRVETTLVLIPVTVTDASNRFVLGLDKDNFRVFENGIQQKITNLSGEDAPLSVGLLIDTSGSMGAKLNISRRAASQFLETMHPQDEAFIIEFSDRAELVEGFTHHADELKDKITSLESEGLTAMLDAVHLGIDEMKKAKNPRKALLIISDGGDNNSRYSNKEIEDLVREADVQIYAMGVFDPISYMHSPAEISGPKLLSEIAQQTGGKAFAAPNDGVLPIIARKIGIELRNQYVLAYTPTDQQRDGKYRKVEVKLKGPAGLSDLKARWRSGYYAPNR